MCVIQSLSPGQLQAIDEAAQKLPTDAGMNHTCIYNVYFNLHIYTALYYNTVEPLNKGHIGTSSCFVLCR